MTMYELTQDGILAAAEAKKAGTLTDGKLPVRVARATLKEALLYYWGRGIALDPSHLKWSLQKAASH